MTKGDELVEKSAERLEGLAHRAEEAGGLPARLAPELAEDASFLRKLKPSLIAARAKGELPTDQEPGSPTPARSSRRPKGHRGRKGPSPLIVLAGAFALGSALAKLIDWRGHAHPRV
jgi:hypothetical protein